LDGHGLGSYQKNPFVPKKVNAGNSAAHATESLAFMKRIYRYKEEKVHKLLLWLSSAAEFNREKVKLWISRGDSPGGKKKLCIQ
jgi:hypothetical protein